jgi:glycerol kinase
MSEAYLLAMDQSTQSTKAFLFDRKGGLVARTSRPHRQLYPAAGQVEHDPMEILHNTLDVLALVVREAGISPSKIVSLSITNQRETIVAWDRGTGAPVHNALVWQDERGSGICRELEACGAGPGIRASTGLKLDPYFSASKLSWLAKHSPAARKALAAGNLMAGTMDTWLIWNLTGRKVFATDYSNASRTMLFNIGTLAWDKELLQLFGLEGLNLPEPRCSDASFGFAIVPGLERDLPIRGVMGDSHAALFGHCGWKEGDAKATYGTGSSLMSNSGPFMRMPPEGIVVSLAWGFRGAASYVFEGNIHATGYTIAWLKDNLGLFSSDEEAERLAAELPDSGGVYLVPAFSGLGAPYWEHGIRASITGLSHGSDKRHIIRAGIESIAYQIMDLVAAMDAGTPRPLAVLHVDGGPSRNALLMQFQADMLGIPVIAPQREELSALGAAYMGGLGGGFWTSLEEIEALQTDSRHYLPSMKPEARRALAEGWKSAVMQAISRKVE